MMLAAEIKRAFSNWSFLTSFLVGLTLAVAQVALVALPYGLGSEWASWQSGGKGFYPNSVLNSWMGATPFSLCSALFFFVLPLLACVPHAGSLYSDLKGGLAANIVTRCDTARYFLAKSAATFFSAGVVAVFPLLANLVGTAMFVPLLDPEPSAGTFFVASSAMLSDLFYEAPWFYVAFFVIIDFAACGILACSCLFFAYFFSNSFVVTATPFILCVISHFALGNAQGYSPINFLNPAQAYSVQLSLVLAECMLLAIAEAAFLAWQRRRFEVL